MRYHHVSHTSKYVYHGIKYSCDHPVYSECTLYLKGELGLAVIQQRYEPFTKHTWWGEIDSGLVEEIYSHERFESYFLAKAGHKSNNGLYPTVSVRQIMWGLRMKPLPRQSWETVFDRTCF